MKLNTLKTLTLMVMLLISTGAMAADTFIYKLNGADPGGSTPGTATLSKTSTEGTITVTPSPGYYLIVENLKVTKKIDGSNAQTRMGINTPITLTPTDANADLSGETTYTFGITDTDYEYDITVDFGERLPLNASGINTLVTISGDNYDYTGGEIKPTTTSVKRIDTNGTSPVEETLVANKDFTLVYQNNIYPTYYRGNVFPTVIVRGKSKYIDEASPVYFNIKPTIAFAKASYETTYGAAFTAPTATIAPNTANITNQNYDGMTFTAAYEATDANGNATDVITVNASTGVVTINKAGTAKVTAKALINEGSPMAPQYITTSYTLTINKATVSLSYSKNKAEAWLDETFTAPTLNNPNNVAVTYSSSNTNVATISDQGVVTPLAVGKTKIMAIFEGDGWYYDQTVSYELSVKERYDLLVNDTRVTSDNNKNVLGDGHFFYDENTKQLVVTSNESPVTIESRMKNLTIFLNGSSKLERVFFNNEGDEQNTGSLTFTTYENIPGKVVLETSHADGVISGFSSLTIDNKSYTYLLDPEDGKYEGGKLVTAVGAVAMTATIGQYLKPLVNGQTVTFPPGKFSIDDLTNNVIDEILYTMVQRAYDSDEDDDYYDPVESAIVLNNLNSTNGITLLLDNVEKGVLIPGTNDYAEQFKGGITFMVPNGKGTITLNVQTEPGYKLMLMIGKSDPKEIVQNERGDVQFTYDVESATYCCIYLVQTAGTRGTRLGKRNKAHGKVYSVQVDVDRCTSTNPLSNVAGFPEAQTPEVETGSGTTGIISIPIQQETGTSEDNRWFTLSGQQVEQPTKPGLYIRNKKVIIIK